MRKIINSFLIAIFIFSTFSIAQLTEGWKLKGQIQLRSEIDGRDFANETHALSFTSLRTRLGVEKTFNEKVQLFVQFQDSRVFGEERNTLAAIDNVDLHQAYLKLMRPFDLDINVQAGRFDVAYGTERFIGSVGWHYIGRSFDGVRFEIAPSSFPIEVFALTLNESNSYIGNANPAIYPLPDVPTPAHSLYGIFKKFNLVGKSSIDVLGYFEENRFKSAGLKNLEAFTLAGTYFGNYDALSTIIEAAYQTGKAFETDLSAYLLSGQVKFKVEEFNLGFGADILSGTKYYSQDWNTFSPTFGTNHKFYGYMDYFINIPFNTVMAGLNDFYLMADLQPRGSKFSFNAMFHHFMSNTPVLVTSITDPSVVEQSTFGQELDLTVKYAFVEGTSFTWGGSLFFPGDLMKTLFAPREDTAFWTYLMITANL